MLGQQIHNDFSTNNVMLSAVQRMHFRDDVRHACKAEMHAGIKLDGNETDGMGVLQLTSVQSEAPTETSL